MRIEMGRKEESHPVIRIPEVNMKRLSSMMQHQISETPKLLSKAAGRISCCIFRIPHRLTEINGDKVYLPHIVSIGPYHRGEAHLKMIEEHKWRYLGSLLSRTQTTKGLGLEDYLKALQTVEKKAREYYSETIQLNTDDFIEMMLLDGCFIVEILRKVGKVIPVEDDDPLFTMSWVFPFFLRDFLCLENQLPFFILDFLFDLTKLEGEETGPSLVMLALEFFNNAFQRPNEVIQRYHNLEGKHLLDLLRLSFIPLDQHEYLPLHKGINSQTHIVPCISKLRRAGITLKPAKADSFLTIKFTRGVIEMPIITIDDFTSSFLLNCVPFEQCNEHCSKHITSYAVLLNYLIDASKDVEYLCDRNIIENYFGTDAEVAHFINNLGKDLTLDMNRCYLSDLFNDVHRYYKNGWHVQWASFKYTYFDTPWSFIATLAAVILLILTFTQTFYTIFPYFHPPDDHIP